MGLWLIAILAALGLVVQVIKVRGSKDERAAIRHAVRASLGDLQRRDARALCNDFAPAVKVRLAAGPAANCEANVMRLFSATSGVTVIDGPRRPPWRLRVMHVNWHGDRATADSMFPGRPESMRRWRLQMLGGRWRIETATELHVQTDCRHDLSGQRACTRLVSMREVE